MRSTPSSLCALLMAVATRAAAQGAPPPAPASTAAPAPLPPPAPVPAPATPGASAPPPPSGAFPYPYYPYPYPYAPMPGAYPGHPGAYPYSPPPPVLDDEGQAQPPGYHRETRPRRGPVIGGWITFGVMYGITATVGLNARDESLLVVPVVGPLARSASRDCDSDLGCEGARTLYMYSFLGQATGAALLAYGYGAPNKVFVRDAGALRVVPIVSAQTSGLSAIGAF